MLCQRELLPSEANETTPHRNVSVNSPDERQSEQSAWVPMLLGTCEAELEEVCVHEREQQLTRRQLLKPSHFQPNEELLGNTGRWCPSENTPLKLFKSLQLGTSGTRWLSVLKSEANWETAVRHSCAVEAFKTNSDNMPPKLNNCPSWDFGHLGNGCLENADSVRMSHDVAVHIIATPRETGQQKNKRTQRY